MKQKSSPFSPVGAGSLLVAFAILCLTVFALLSLTTAHREQRLSESAHRAVTEYYEADFQAQEVFARLRAGEIPSQVTRDGDLYTYQIPISQYNCLEVAIARESAGWRVLRWQLVTQTPEDDVRPLEVWTQQEETP